MYISTFEIKKPAYLLWNMDNLHKAVMKMFSENRSKENVLFMILEEKSEFSRKNRVCLVIQSDHAPQNIPGDLKLLHSKDCTERFSSIQNGDIVQFYGMFEPSKRSRNASKSKNARISIDNPAARMEWLIRKFQEAGNFIGINEKSRQKVYVKKNSGDIHESNLYGYECRLHITNAEKFRELVQQGIGRSKAYGGAMCLILHIYHKGCNVA